MPRPGSRARHRARHAAKARRAGNRPPRPGRRPRLWGRRPPPEGGGGGNCTSFALTIVAGIAMLGMIFHIAL